MRRRRSIVLAGWTLAIAGLLLIAAWQLARSRQYQLFGELVRRVEIDEPWVAITFDDGPTAGVADSLLVTLGARGIPATFFVIGNELAANPDVGRRLVDGGHELGNHTYSHERMVLRSQSFIRREVESTDSLIRAAGQTGPILFRAPYTYKLFGLPRFLSRTGRTTVTTDVEPESDPATAASSDAIVSHVLERVGPGSIILLHPWYASRAPTREALPMVLDSLLARGFRFTTVSDLIERAP